jgi:hypothetical protein
MMVGERENQVEYRGVGYAFCSHQCRERFASAPGLYVGRRRWLAPKQKGMEVIKRRRMVLGVPITPMQFVGLKGALLSMMGVIAVRAVETMSDGCHDPQRFESGTPMTPRIEAVEISYDLLQATAKQLECKFVEPIAALSNGWGQKLQRDFIHYLENCELDDLAIRAAVPAGRGGRTRRTSSGSKSGTRTQLGHGRGNLKE